MARVNWRRIPGTAKDIGSVGNEVWIIGVDPNENGDVVYRWTGGRTGNPWQPMNGSGTRISVAASGIVWLVNQQKDIYAFCAGQFTNIPGKATDIDSFGGWPNQGYLGSTVFVVGVEGVVGVDEGRVYSYTKATQGYPWAPIGHLWFTRVAVGPESKPWAVNKDKRIYKVNQKGEWEQCPGEAIDIAGSYSFPGGVSWVGVDGQVYIDNSLVQDSVGSKVVSISMEGSDLWVVTERNEIYYGVIESV